MPILKSIVNHCSRNLTCLIPCNVQYFASWNPSVAKFDFKYSFLKGPSFIRSWTFGMFSDSESTGGSSESRSLDSESISPGT